MTRIFERSWHAKIYGEFSKLHDPQDNFRLKPYEEIKDILGCDSAPFIISKPLVETQNILRLLDYFRCSKAIWLYRNYKDVASSNLNKFGTDNGIKDLRPIVENRFDNWRSENVPSAVRETVKKYYWEDMNPYDAAALFWYVRNSFFLTLELNKNPSVYLCNYDDLASCPHKRVREVFDFLGLKYQEKKIVLEIHPSSIGRGKGVRLSTEVDSLCAGLLAELDKVYNSYRQ